MSKRIGVIAVSILLIMAMSACGMASWEPGGLVGEMLDGIVKPEELETNPEYDEILTPPDPPSIRDGLPVSLKLAGDIAVLEAYKVVSLENDNYLHQSLVEAEQEFEKIYGYGFSHRRYTVNELLKNANTGVMSGEDLPMLCYLPMSELFDVYTAQGFYSNMGLDLYDNGCWDTELNRDLQLQGVQYAFSGALTPFTKLNVACYAINTRTAEQRMGVDLYEYYENGEWTFDVYAKVTRDAKADNGLICDNSVYHITDCRFYGSGIELFDNKTLSINPDFYSIDIDSLKNTLDSVSGSASSGAEQLFLELEKNRLLLFTSLAAYAGLNGNKPFAEQASFEVGLIPTPKYDVAAEYASSCAPANTTVLCVPLCFRSSCSEAINAYAILMAERYEQGTAEWLQKVTPDDRAYAMAYRMMDTVRVDTVGLLLQEGYQANCNPLYFVSTENFHAYIEQELARCLARLREDVLLTPGK